MVAIILIIMSYKFQEFGDTYFFKFHTDLIPKSSDIVYISISKLFKFNDKHKENQHLLIIKRPYFQENVSMNINNIIQLLKKYNIQNAENILVNN